MDAIAVMSIIAVEFGILVAVGCLLAKALGVDEIVAEIERAHQCCNTNGLRK